MRERDSEWKLQNLGFGSPPTCRTRIPVARGGGGARQMTSSPRSSAATVPIARGGGLARSPLDGYAEWPSLSVAYPSHASSSSGHLLTTVFPSGTLKSRTAAAPGPPRSAPSRPQPTPAPQETGEDENWRRRREGLEELLFNCCICMYPLTQATLCPRCSNLWCQACIHRWLADKSQCPNCRASLTVADLVPARFMDDVQRKLARLQQHQEQQQQLLLQSPPPARHASRGGSDVSRARHRYAVLLRHLRDTRLLRLRHDREQGTFLRLSETSGH